MENYQTITPKYILFKTILTFLHFIFIFLFIFSLSLSLSEPDWQLYALYVSLSLSLSVCAEWSWRVELWDRSDYSDLSLSIIGTTNCAREC